MLWHTLAQVLCRAVALFVSAMKTLFLLRHAKSSWSDESCTDHERPLSERGQLAAPRMAQYFREQGLKADAIWVSTATRTRQTYDLMARAFDGVVLRHDDALYGTSSTELIGMLARQGGDARSILVLGHNPCMEMTAWSLLREDQLRTDPAQDMARKFPTCALAQIELPIETWKDLSAGSGSLIRFVKPKSL